MKIHQSSGRLRVPRFERTNWFCSVKSCASHSEWAWLAQAVIWQGRLLSVETTRARVGLTGGGGSVCENDSDMDDNHHGRLGSSAWKSSSPFVKKRLMFDIAKRNFFFVSERPWNLRKAGARWSSLPHPGQETSEKMPKRFFRQALQKMKQECKWRPWRESERERERHRKKRETDRREREREEKRREEADRQKVSFLHWTVSSFVVNIPSSLTGKCVDRQTLH